jgi:nitrilase
MPDARIAAVQTASVFLDREATVAKACDLITSAAANDAQLVVFPESFIPAYPDWISVIPAGDYAQWSELYAEMVEQSVAVPGPAVAELCAAARRAGVYVAIGVTERNAEASNASLYNTLLYIDPQGQLLGKHRKLVPTAAERLIWAQGNGDTLAVYETGLGRIGGLICWENYMPLARYALYSWGVQIYLAPTWDRGDGWLATVRHIAREGRVYVVGCSIALHLDDIPDRYAFKQQYQAGTGWINSGDSAIAGPDGSFLAGPLHDAVGILYADIDTRQVNQAKWMLDIAGHYARPDVFQLTIDRHVRPVVADIPSASQPISTPPAASIDITAEG